VQNGRIWEGSSNFFNWWNFCLNMKLKIKISKIDYFGGFQYVEVRNKTSPNFYI
jgi:hypothetical protein